MSSTVLDILVDIARVGTGHVEIETKKPCILVKCRVPTSCELAPCATPSCDETRRGFKVKATWAKPVGGPSVLLDERRHRRNLSMSVNCTVLADGDMKIAREKL